MIKNTPLLTAAAVAAAFAVGAPAASAAGLPLPGDPAFDVPTGKVEHTITTVDVTGSNAIESHQRQELWLSQTRGRMLIRDSRTGKLQREVTYAPGEMRTYDASQRTVQVIRDKRLKSPPWNSFTFESAVQKTYVEQGYVKVVGEKVVNGRRALVTESNRPKWRSDNASDVTTAVVDADTFVLYERTTAQPDGEYAQHEVHEVTEVLDAGAPAARTAMSRHKGAKVVRKVRR